MIAVIVGGIGLAAWATLCRRRNHVPRALRLRPSRWIQIRNDVPWTEVIEILEKPEWARDVPMPDPPT